MFGLHADNIHNTCGGRLDLQLEVPLESRMVVDECRHHIRYHDIGGMDMHED